MASLLNKTKNLLIVNNVLEANSLFSRMKGLLGKKHLETDTTLWIHSCNSIHTWFMKFCIDAVFVDKALIVKAIYRNIKPGKFIFPVIGAKSVFEFSAGVIDPTQLEIGDQLNVGD